MTALEIRLACYAVLLVVVGGWLTYERFHLVHEGEAICHREDQTAALKDAARTHQIDQETIDGLRQQLAQIASPAAPSGQSAPHIRVCIAPGILPARVSASGTQPVAGTVEGSDRGMPAGVAAEIDAGPSMQDFALTGLFYLSDSEELFNRAVKQAASSH